ncbi:hypothetical protein [Streptosporangium sp. CA-115845]|uniref:hypothetical protein n=1 Tax=Streptosporangium sp. CA-115845 TaxID=3240071 RepID=UPI003D9089A2
MARQASPKLTQIIVRNANQKAAEADRKGDTAKAQEWQKYADDVRSGAPVLPD